MSFYLSHSDSYFGIPLYEGNGMLAMSRRVIILIMSGNWISPGPGTQHQFIRGGGNEVKVYK